VDVALNCRPAPNDGQAVKSLAVMGRAVVAGISDRPLEIDTYHE
jgi:hypothetical protein